MYKSKCLTKCANNYGFLGSDRSKSIFVNNNEYYTEDNAYSVKNLFYISF